jgi:hypothetical protein
MCNPLSCSADTAIAGCHELRPVHLHATVLPPRDPISAGDEPNGEKHTYSLLELCTGENRDMINRKPRWSFHYSTPLHMKQQLANDQTLPKQGNSACRMQPLAKGPTPTQRRKTIWRGTNDDRV